MPEPARLPEPARAPHAAIANLGCKVNQSEMDDVERLLRARGVEVVDGHSPADLVILNTCTVTSIADRKSRQILRRLRRTSPDATVFVTGCLVTVDPASLAAVDGAARLYDNDSKPRLLDELERLLVPNDGTPLPTLSGVDASLARPNEPAQPVGSARRWALSGPDVREDDFSEEEDIDRTRAFVKIQDGCSFHCTYCIIPRARGRERSMPAETVLAEVRRATSAGHREVVLTGINAGTYTEHGSDSGTELGLPGLVRRILAETEVERIRLSSIEPQHVTDDLLDVWAGSAGRCLPHFHVPLQSGDDTILRRMGRRYDAASYAELVGRLRQTIPGVAVHADLIVGFPGEDDAAWARTAAFLQDLDLAGIHVFRYSARPGTPAARMIGQVDGRTKKRRSAEALALAAEARARFATRHLGGESRVLFERQLPDGRWLGHAENHVLVSAAPPGGSSLENAVGLVRAESIDTTAPDRIVGRLLAIDPPRSPETHPAASPEPLAEAAFK